MSQNLESVGWVVQILENLQILGGSEFRDWCTDHTIHLCRTVENNLNPDYTKSEWFNRVCEQSVAQQKQMGEGACVLFQLNCCIPLVVYFLARALMCTASLSLPPSGSNSKCAFQKTTLKGSN